MKKFLVSVILSLFCVICIQQSHATRFQIYGVKGPVLKNIKLRLDELDSQGSFKDKPSEFISEEITTAMYPFGFFKPHVQIKNTHSTVRIYINKGPKILIKTMSVIIKGPGKYDSKIQAIKNQLVLKLKPGSPFISKEYDDFKDKLSTAAEEEGYLRSTFEGSKVRIDKNQYFVEVCLVFTTGPLYYFGNITFDNSYISKKLLYRYVPFQTGEPYSTDKILNLNNRLASSGYFKNVNVNPLIEDKTSVPVKVILEPVRKYSYVLGAGYGTDTGPRALGRLNVIPVNPSGDTFQLVAQGSFTENALLAQYSIPGYHPDIDTYNITGGASTLNYATGYGNSYTISLNQRHSLKNFKRILSLNGLNERFHYTNQHNTEKSMLYPKGIFTWAQTTDPLFSPNGYNITLNAFGATKVLLSQINIAQLNLDIKAAYTFNPMKTRVFLHTIQGITVTNNIDQEPFSLAQFLGGSLNLKGYSYNAIGPGKYLSYEGIEIQKETVSKWYILGFVDAGDIFNPSPFNMKLDAGLGLMWISPIGPIKIAVAQPLDTRFNPFKSRSPKFVINMGSDLS